MIFEFMLFVSQDGVLLLIGRRPAQFFFPGVECGLLMLIAENRARLTFNTVSKKTGTEFL